MQSHEGSTLDTEKDAPSPAKRKWRWIGRLFLLAVGIFAVFFMIHQLGWQKIGSTMIKSAVWLPWICLLDFGWVLLEGGALLVIYGRRAREIPWKDWLYVSMVHYAAFMLLPVGRATAEVTRAGLVKKHIGRDLANVGAALMQSLTLFANATACLAAAIFVLVLGNQKTLLGAMMVNSGVMYGFAVASYLVMRHVKIGGWLGGKFKKLADAGPGFDEQFKKGRSRHGWALLFCFVGRVIQTLQYGVIVVAVTGNASVARAFIAEGIQMVARSAGDFIPNQVGVTEGAFVLFRSALDLENASAKAMSIALTARISNMIVASVCILISQLWPSRRRTGQTARLT